MNWLIAYDGGKKITTKLATETAQKRAIAVSMKLEPTRNDTVYSNNVIGIIKGSDPALSQEYVLLSAHYDHIGTGKSADGKDTIYNGARDNGMGTTALLAATKYLASKPPKRSIVLLACTAEEVGLLGSGFYATHPAVPHKSVVYNLNTDGAGFNDTTRITVIGLERTTAQPLLEEAAKANGLKAASDPAPEQNLFDRSDNVSFAKLGIPAPTFSAGFTAFDAEIFKYYHQLADEAGEDFNFRYLTRYVNTFIAASRLIADAKERPRWKTGDKYEAAFNLLYGGK
jgi:Zn-dependent M28 family amino/carboxypeptidase